LVCCSDSEEHFFRSSLKKAVDAIGDVATQQQKVSPFEECRKFSNRTTLLPGDVPQICLIEIASSFVFFGTLLRYHHSCDSHAAFIIFIGFE
jgi:hypothetical protein